MKGIVLRDYEIRRLQSAGSVLIWRRVNPQPCMCVPSSIAQVSGALAQWREVNVPKYGCEEHAWINGGPIHDECKCPFGATGETRFVKETWRSWDEEQRIIYKADYQPIEMKMRWKSPASMPAEASRFNVTLSVSCRQIQSVTEEQAVRSGSQDPVGHWKPVLQARFTERAAFKQIMERVERGSWDRNEWFWAIEAKEVK